MSRFMNHNDYSNWVILRAAERAKEGNYKTLTHAFKIAAKKLNCRPSQVSSKYYDLKHRGITLESVANWTEQDKKNFDAGAPEKIIRSYPKGQGHKVHTEERFIPVKNEEIDVKVTLTKNEDGSETVDFERVRGLIKTLTKNMPLNTRLDVMSDLAENI